MMGTESPVKTAIDRFVFVVVFKQVKGGESWINRVKEKRQQNLDKIV